MPKVRVYVDTSVFGGVHDEELASDLGTGVVLVAVRDGRLVGSVRGKMRGKMRGETQGGGETCYVARLSVDPGFMNRGIGTRLMHAIEAEFPDARRYELMTGHRSERVLRLYERLGYGRFRDEPVSDEVTLVWMEKENTP